MTYTFKVKTIDGQKQYVALFSGNNLELGLGVKTKKQLDILMQQEYILQGLKAHDDFKNIDVKILPNMNDKNTLSRAYFRTILFLQSRLQSDYSLNELVIFFSGIASGKFDSPVDLCPYALVSPAIKSQLIDVYRFFKSNKLVSEC